MKVISADQSIIDDFAIAEWPLPGAPVLTVKTTGDPAELKVSVEVLNILGAIVHRGRAHYDAAAGLWRHRSHRRLWAGEVLTFRAFVTTGHARWAVRLIWVPHHLRLASDFTSPSWSRACGLGRWQNN